MPVGEQHFEKSHVARKYFNVAGEKIFDTGILSKLVISKNGARNEEQHG
jgi:hypothetical protein